MEVAFIVSVLLLTLSFGTKSIIHAVLDARNGHRVEYGSAKGYVYFMPYDKEVSQKDERLKQICNLLHPVSIFSLILFLLVFFVKIIIEMN
jgi:hypothetical protein